eukprot:CAMPEP_0173171540 /NCGR_PEP_ID=MMETSP1141-20130122/1821_1 /TAXON_ID=483371 /ORGANISM="non described non described, Strain CCMP2298" /LENGTH=107 /DNA_ID=CAMNT_0014093499 /DNA_START=80 /DNA_END=403 /DNA_ORIENTATION=-
MPVPHISVRVRLSPAYHAASRARTSSQHSLSVYAHSSTCSRPGYTDSATERIAIDSTFATVWGPRNTPAERSEKATEGICWDAASRMAARYALASSSSASSILSRIL